MMGGNPIFRCMTDRIMSGTLHDHMITFPTPLFNKDKRSFIRNDMILFPNDCQHGTGYFVGDTIRIKWMSEQVFDGENGIMLFSNINHVIKGRDQ